jgi:hypothetical protein
MTARTVLATALAALLLAPIAAAQESSLPAEVIRHHPEHMTAKALHAALDVLAKRHGDGLQVSIDGDFLSVVGLPEDVEAMRAIILLVDLPPIEPVADHSIPKLVTWENEKVYVLPLHDDVEREKMHDWLTRLIGFHPTARSIQMVTLGDVRRLLIVGTPAEVGMASKAAEILLEAYHAGYNEGGAQGGGH